MKAWYYWTEDGERELVAIYNITTEKDALCYHCGSLIAANSPAAQLRTMDDTYILHKDCCLKNCDLHPSEQGMRGRLERFLQKKDE